MKDATGELSMTAIAVVAIAAIGVVFTTLIWPNIKANIERNTYCSQAYNCTGTGTLLDCTYVDKDNNEKDIKCPKQDTTVK
ncbi:MAG: hypothetical protein PHD03_01550 [Bacilli bacterium]|nr:hypothetical protein [Bacilli bacterium]MDD4407240.1 hypothetical protein [Bacilli bacterium]